MKRNRVAAALIVVVLALTASAIASEGADGRSRRASSTPAIDGPPDFDRHIAPLLGRLGCNAGKCHGAFEGRGGFRLSLFGYNPAADWRAITRQDAGRRVFPADPESSLLLRKPTLRVSHQGGKRLERASWEYRLIEEWIAAGAIRQPHAPAIAALHLSPSRSRFDRPAGSTALTLVATFDDGSQADVTRFGQYRSQDEAVATVSDEAVVHAGRSGDTSLVATYAGKFATAVIRVARDDPEFIWPAPPAANAIDTFVFDKLRELRIVPSALSDDAEFLRRVTIDTTGQLPTPDEVRDFLADASADKRWRKIEDLLTRPLHAAVWATRLSDITGNDVALFGRKTDEASGRAGMWYDWLHRRIAENAPWDSIVRGVLTATSRGDATADEWIDRETELTREARDNLRSSYPAQPALDLFWRRGNDQEFPAEDIAERIAAAFLGIRIECARCHQHPFDRWSQADYRGFSNLFTQVRYGMSPELRAAMFERLESRRQGAAEQLPASPLPPVREVYLAERFQDLVDPETGVALRPQPLGGPELASAVERRQAFADWLCQPQNPQLARNLVNRVWSHYFGRGLVEPVDAFSLSNPPSHPELLDWMARDFAEHGYDLRRLERLILTSATYQLSSRPNETNRDDDRNLSHAVVRVLSAEAIVDSLQAAIGEPLAPSKDVRAGARAVELPTSQVRNGRVAQLFRLFGRPERKTACDCERPTQPTIRQALFLISDARLQAGIAEGRVKQLTDRSADDNEAVEELFLSTLSRLPDEFERQAAAAHLAAMSDRPRALADLLWALINTREFLTNH